MNYTQLLTISESDGQALNIRVRAAILVAANRVAREVPTTLNHANRVKWAVAALANPAAPVDSFMRAIAAQRSADDPVTVRTLTDSQVQTEVDSLIDFFAQG